MYRYLLRYCPNCNHMQEFDLQKTRYVANTVRLFCTVCHAHILAEQSNPLLVQDAPRSSRIIPVQSVREESLQVISSSDKGR